MAIPIGPLAVLSNIKEVRETILDELQVNISCEVDCASVKEVDLTFLQLLVSTHKFADREGKSISILPSAAPEVVSMLERAGIACPDSVFTTTCAQAGATQQ